MFFLRSAFYLQYWRYPFTRPISNNPRNTSPPYKLFFLKKLLHSCLSFRSNFCIYFSSMASPNNIKGADIIKSASKSGRHIWHASIKYANCSIICMGFLSRQVTAVLFTPIFKSSSMSYFIHEFYLICVDCVIDHCPSNPTQIHWNYRGN